MIQHNQTVPNYSLSLTSEFKPGLVSVIVPTYNRADLIIHTLQSILAQTYRPIEILVVDDGSIDNTRQIVEQFAAGSDPELQVRYFYQGNKGVSAARNKGLAECLGEFIQFLDSDDLLDQNKFSIQITELKKHPEMDFIYSSSARFLSDPKNGLKPYTGFKCDDFLVVCIGRHPLPWCTDSGIYRRRVVSKIGPWDEELYCFEDWEYHFRLCLSTAKIGFLPGIMSFVRSDPHLQITNTEFTGRWLASAVLAINKISAQLKSRGLMWDDRIANALARAFFQIGRRAALLGETQLCHQLMEKSQSLTRHADMRALNFTWGTAAAILGNINAGRLFERTLELSKRFR